MEALAGLGFLVLFCLSALVGVILRGRLAEHHLSAENMDALRLVTGLLVTFSALVLSLQLSSSRSAFDGANRNRVLHAGELVRLDLCLRDLGPGLAETRMQLRQYTAAVIGQTWPGEPTPPVEGRPDASAMTVRGEGVVLARLLDAVGLGVEAANPAEPPAAHTAARCRADYASLQRSRWTVIEDADQASGGLFIGIIGFWLVLVFLSFGLQVPRRRLSGIVLAVGVASIASVMFVIVDLGTPYSGLFGIRSTAMRAALVDMSR